MKQHKKDCNEGGEIEMNGDEEQAMNEVMCQETRVKLKQKSYF